MRRLLIALLVLGAATCTAAAQHTSNTFDGAYPSTIYAHNGSSMELRTRRGIIEITYLFPRADLTGTGADSGVVLFEGVSGASTYVEGIAYIFSRNCGEIPYRVSGGFVMSTDLLVLDGASPRVDYQTCRVLGYEWGTKNSRLVFNRDRRPIRE